MTKKLTSKEVLSRELKTVSACVTAKDRADFMRVKNVSASKLSMYLNGKVWDEDVALEMLKYFRRKIEKRQVAISKTVNA